MEEAHTVWSLTAEADRIQPAFVTRRPLWLCWSLWQEQHVQAGHSLLSAPECGDHGG